MALTDFKPHFDNAYEDVFMKTTSFKMVGNARFEKQLTYGESVERVAYDISGVQVRTVTRSSASTIDSVTDSSALLEINIEKEAVFHISDGEVKQAGPLNPGAVIGAKIARKMAIDLDGKFYAQVLNASHNFDNGDLTTLSSTGTGITLNSTTVPQMTTRMNAKLTHRNQIDTSTNMVLVVDSYAASDIEAFLISKSIDMAGYVFKNGYAGKVNNSDIVISESLTGEAVLSTATQVTAGDTFTINGVTWTFRAVPAIAGEIDIGADIDATRVIIANAINASATGLNSATGYFEVSTANRAILTNAGIVATDSPSANTTTIVGTGSGRLVVSETLTDATDAWTKNIIHAYYGKKGAIDIVVQDMKEVDMRETADRRGTNVFSSYLAGIKTFADGAKQFLDVNINA